MSDTPHHLTKLNPEQHRAVASTGGPLLVLAGAGSGKTRVLTRRIAHLLHEGVSPENILAVTFTNKAAAEMKERIVELIGEAGEKLWVSTFHSTCARILRADIEAMGWTRRFAIYDDDDQLRLLKEIITQLGYDLEHVVPRAVLSQIDHHKNRMVGPDALIAQRRTHLNAPFIRVWRDYEHALKAADAVDFNDLIGLTVRLFNEHPDVLERWRDRFRYILVDEYQDTNKAQYDLLRCLAPTANANLTVVGDDDQSIYGFRGADVTNILNFEQDYPGATVIRMEQNYRCTGNILTLANAVVQVNVNRLAKKLWTEAEAGPKVHMLVSETPDDEAKRVADAIHKLCRHRGHTFGDFAIIYRTNAIGRGFERALQNQRIPYRLVGGRKFYERREVRDILCYLRLLVNPADDAALLRIINVPSRGIGAKKLERLREEAGTRGVPLLQAAQSLAVGVSADAKAIKVFVDIIDDLLDASQTASAGELVKIVIEATGYLDMLQEDKSDDAKTRAENLDQLVRDARTSPAPAEVATAMDRLRAWLDRVALAGQDEELPEGGEVTMMTVHCAKGLEYPVVFVTHMMQGQFPHSKSLEESLDEERRLAYVAFTRAQQRLIVTRSRQTRSGPERARRGLKDVQPSIFLFGLPAEVCEGDLPEARPAVDDLSSLDPDERLVQRRHRAFLRRNAPVHDHFAPPGDYALIDVEELEQLAAGVLVHVARTGFGRIRTINRRGPQVYLDLELAPDTFKSVPLLGSEVHLVVD